MSKYYTIGKYIGEEFPNELNEEIQIGNDEENQAYKICFIHSGFEADNIFEEEIEFNIESKT